MQPMYDLTKSYEENVTYGPFWDGTYPQFVKRRGYISFLGYRLNSPIGVPACPLTVNARFVGVCSKLGFDLLTFKSVRSIEWHGNEYPHWLYVNAPRAIRVEKKASFTAGTSSFLNQEPSMANSFGIHSVKPVYWQDEFRQAQANLLSGQLLILSVQPTQIPGKKLIDDARDLARLALEARANVVEINFACPNTDAGKGMIFDDVDLAPKVCERMMHVLEHVPLLIKVGFYKSDETLREILRRTKGVISGVSTANTYPGKVVDQKGGAAFPNRPYAGVSGAVIRDSAMRQAKKFVDLKKELDLKKFVVIGIGGVTKSLHVDAYLQLGVDAVQSAVGAFIDPYLAAKYRKSV